MNVHDLICFELTAYECTWFICGHLMDDLYLVVKWIFIMDLVIYDAHIVRYHMNLLCMWLWVKAICPSRLSGHSMLDLGHLAVSNKYYSSGDTKFLEVCLTV